VTTVWVDEDNVDRLSGWKEIAQFLSSSVRSAQRWEQEAGLPVKRVKTANGQVVYASRAELTAWAARFHALPGNGTHEPQPMAQALDEHREFPAQIQVPVGHPPKSNRWRRWVAAALIFVSGSAGLGLGVLLPASEASPAVAVYVFGRVAEARDTQGRTVWMHAFDLDVSGVDVVVGLPSAMFGTDINADGAAEVIVPVRFPVHAGKHVASLRRSDALYAFTADGHVLWQAALPSSYTISCGGEVITGPWQLTAMAVQSGPGPKTVWAAFRHLTLRPSVVLEIAPDGHQAVRYVQAGPILGLADWTTPEGPALAVVGAMGSPARASLVQLDPRRGVTMMTESVGGYSCEAPGSVAPMQVTLFPPNDNAFEYPHQWAAATKVMPLEVGLRVDLSGGAIALIARDGTVSEVAFSDEYRAQHDQVKRLGRVDHLAADCPALHGEVRTWTPKDGWRAYDLGSKPRH